MAPVANTLLAFPLSATAHTLREGVPRQTKRGGRYWLFRPLCFEFGSGRLPALCILDQRSCWTPSDGSAAIPRFAHSSRADTEILRIIRLVIVGLVSARALPAPLAVPLRAIAALRLRSEHGSSHAHWARWGTIMRTSLASRASSDGAHPDRADSRIGPARAFLYRTRTHRCSPSPKCLPHIPGLSDLASTV